MKYRVKTIGLYTQYVVVDAEDEKEAIEKAMAGDCYDDGKLLVSPLFVPSVDDVVVKIEE